MNDDARNAASSASMSLAEKLQYLFSHHNPRGQTPPSLEYVSEQISSQGERKSPLACLVSSAAAN